MNMNPKHIRKHHRATVQSTCGLAQGFRSLAKARAYAKACRAKGLPAKVTQIP